MLAVAVYLPLSLTKAQRPGRLAALITLGAMAVVLAGCAEQGAPEFGAPPPAGVVVEKASSDQPLAKNEPAAGGEAIPVDAGQISAEVQRKIIYTAYIDVVVKDLDDAVASVQQMIQEHKGYIAKSEVRGQIGQRRTAEFTLRVPVDNFPVLRDALLRLGAAERNALESKDVTEEYVDVEARLRILKQEEEALNKILRETTNRQELLLTRQRVMEVRSQIEAAQGRLNMLSRLSALATIHLKLREEQHYRPPETTAAPTYFERIRTTFANSTGAVSRFLVNASLMLVALIPWLPIILPVGLLLVWLRRRWHARRQERSTQQPAAA